MVSTLKSRILTYIAFLAPALIVYAIFFLIPLGQGIWYSLTDWNGIVPEIPLTLGRTEFESGILAKIRRLNEREYLRRHYHLTPAGDSYQLTHWVVENDKHPREITRGERRRIKGILGSVGVSNIRFVGLANFREMFRSDPRFLPRFEKRYLFNEFDDLPRTMTAVDFSRRILSHLANPGEERLLDSCYTLHRGTGVYRLKAIIGVEEEARLRQLLAARMTETVFVPNVLGFTAFFTFFNVLLANLFALFLALVLDGKLRTRVALRSIFFMPNVLSLVVVAFVWHYIFMLILPTITGIDIWLGSVGMAPWAVVIVSVWQSCGWLMVIYLAGLQAIPTEFQEAAEADGANWLQRLRFIKLPLLAPAVTVCLFYSLANSLKSFDIIFALTQGNPAYTTVPVVLDIYYNAFNLNRFGYATAKAVFLCLVIMGVTGLQLYFTKRREVEL